jgi:ATP-dependent protease ClpP protease subunit
MMGRVVLFIERRIKGAKNSIKIISSYLGEDRISGIFISNEIFKWKKCKSISRYFETQYNTEAKFILFHHINFIPGWFFMEYFIFDKENKLEKWRESNIGSVER